MATMLGTTYPYDFSSVRNLTTQDKLTMFAFLSGEPLDNDLSADNQAIVCRVLAVRTIEENPQFLPEELCPETWE